MKEESVIKVKDAHRVRASSGTVLVFKIRQRKVVESQAAKRKGSRRKPMHQESGRGENKEDGADSG